MIDTAHLVASWFLWLGGLTFLVAYGLPLLLAPLQWARVLRWKLPQERDLAVYLGRCLGSVIVAIVLVVWRAAPRPASHPLVFELIIASGALMVGVHAWGAIRRVQPSTETVEIGLYVAVTAFAAWLYAGL